MFDRVRLDEADMAAVLRAMRAVAVQTTASDPFAVALARDELQAKLATGAIKIEAFSRAWRRLERRATVTTMPPDELRLRRARNLLCEFGTLWRNPAVPDQLREEALREILNQVDVDGAGRPVYRFAPVHVWVRAADGHLPNTPPLPVHASGSLAP